VSNNVSNELTGPLNCIVGVLQTELDQLLQQKARIKLRMRNLHNRLSVLQADSRKKKRRISRTKSRRPPNATRRARAQQIFHLHEELARACRIAFLELGGSATPDELYAAILRRGSFSFPAIENKPTVSISHVLVSMAQSGEAVSSNEGSQSRWAYQPKARCFQ
jgi:hypothetical protein